MMVPEEELPIDIQTSKLVNWLVSRRHVKKTWPEAVQIVRGKINNAIQDMPEHADITKLLCGAYINYFHCLQIIEILCETEKESKNIFGWYTSQRMKDWREIVRLYETDNAYLAEASQYLVRNVNFEIPSLKRQIAKCRQTQEDCEKKIEENIKRSTMAQDKYFSSCKKIGIPGENIKTEIVGLLKTLPEKLAVVGKGAKELKEAREFYHDYLHFITNSEKTHLPLLKFVIEHGDATIYEWKYGEPPVTIEEQETALIDVNEPDTNTDGIDFGPIGDAEPANIDYGDDVELETGQIDWGNLEVEGDTLTSNAEEIDFGEAELMESNNAEIVIESSGMEGGIAKGKEALTVLYDEEMRNQFMNELLELEGFLMQRKVELEADENIVSMNLFSNSPRSVQYQSSKSISKFLKLLSETVQELTSTKMQHLYMISSSPRYVDRLADSFNSNLKESDRMLASIDRMKDKGEEATRQQHLLSQQLQLIFTRTKELQENVEKHISLKYKNRTVNLMGGIQHI